MGSNPGQSDPICSLSRNSLEQAMYSQLPQSVSVKWTVESVSAYHVWVTAGQALVVAITGEVDRLLSLDLFTLRDGNQVPERAAITNTGQGSTLTHKQTHTHKSVLRPFPMSE
jgi:hypothetical protein